MLYPGSEITAKGFRSTAGDQKNPRRPVMMTPQITRVVNQVTENAICLHAFAGRAPRAKMCVHNYECATCPFDQMLDDIAPVVSIAKDGPVRTAKAA